MGYDNHTVVGAGRATCCPESDHDPRDIIVSQTGSQKGNVDMGENRDKLDNTGVKGDTYDKP